MSIDKLCLGTAGLGGLPYGIHDRAVSRDQAIRVIRAAYGAGIRCFDTAPTYGEAEQWLADAIGEYGDCAITTKTSGSVDLAIASLRAFGARRTTVMWHNWQGEKLPTWVRGVTVYAADRVEIPDGLDLMVQGDWNLLQQTIHQQRTDGFQARSVFLQGQLAGGTVRAGLQNAVERSAEFAAACGVDLTTLALRAALENPAVDSVVIGPTTTAELEECLEIAERPHLGVNHLIPMLAIDSPETDPRTWSAT